jgi:DNA-binding Lrp family transcriptional regulator
MSIALEVRNRINSFSYGSIIKYTDLIDITDNVMALSKALSRMVQDKKLEKIEKGIFYKPKLSKFGKVGPNINEIINKEIEKDGVIIGYITGINLYNRLGLTTQISNEIEIATNKRKAPKEILGKKIKFIKVDSKINRETIELLQILDAVKRPDKSHNLHSELVEKDYEVLGQVTYTGTRKSAFLVFNWGGAAYNELSKLAEEKYGAHDVINITVDKKVKYAVFYFPVYLETEYTMRGLAIKYKD